MITVPALRLWQTLAALVALTLCPLAMAQVPHDPPVKPNVTGKFTGNGKAAAIKFVAVSEHEPFSGKEAITLVFSEKDATASKKPSFDAMFGRLGSALVLSLHHDGSIFGCEVSHTAHSKPGFSSLGEIKMTDFKMAGGNVSGHVSTGKEVDAFGDKWEVDFTFAAPIPERMRKAPAATSKPVASVPDETSEPAKKAPKVSSGPLIAAQKLPLPKDAADVDFKTTVKQIHFTTPRSVAAVAKEFSANLKQQGWKDGAGSLIGKPNAILQREQGDAKLTIMIQPAGAGSVVRIMTQGLDWSETADAPTAAPRKTAADPSVKGIEAEANKALKDALKNLPKGL